MEVGEVGASLSLSIVKSNVTPPPEMVLTTLLQSEVAANENTKKSGRNYKKKRIK